jgi:hypothetical protein
MGGVEEVDEKEVKEVGVPVPRFIIYKGHVYQRIQQTRGPRDGRPKKDSDVRSN